MTLSRVEIASLAVATVAAGSAIWQGFLTRSAIEAQSSSNLQMRQVDVCAAFLAAIPSFDWHYRGFDEYEGSFDDAMNLGIWSGRPSEEASSLGASSAPEQSGPEQYEEATQQLLAEGERALKQVDEAASALFPFASDATQRQVIEVKWATRALLLPRSETSEVVDAARSQLVHTIGDLARKCRSVMVGDNLGLI